jgi:hypothetical protein
MTEMRMRLIAKILIIVGAQTVWAACDDTLPATGSRDDVLVVINDNAVDSCEVGLYYAEKRILGKNNILHIKTPANPTISYSQYEIYRNQIIRALQQRIATTGVQPVSCSNTTLIWCPEVVSQLKSATSIKYLVITKGIPARVINYSDANWVFGGENSAGSIDGYLRSQLGNFLYPARVDGLNIASAKALVDRAISAERLGWFGNLISAATKSDSGKGPGNSRFAKTDYHPVTTNEVLSEKLVAPVPPSFDPIGKFDQALTDYTFESHQHWRYQFGLFNETDVDCTGNTINGASTNFYLNNDQDQAGGKAPDKCKVKLVKGNGANPAYNETQPGVTWGGRVPLVTNAIAYLGHLDNQPTLSGDFNSIKNWKKTSQCVAQLCKDATDPAACRAASTDVYQELDTRCVGIADGFIGHNFQSWPLSYFTSWPTAWHPLSNPTSTTGFGGEIGGGDVTFMSYPVIRTDTGDGDTNSVWFSAQDKLAMTQCLQSDLTTIVACQDLNRVQIGQAVSVDFSVTASKYYRVSLSYNSISGETNVIDFLRTAIAVRDPNNVNQVPLNWVDASTSPWTVTSDISGLLRDTTNNSAALGGNSNGWKKVSAIFKLDPSTMLAGQAKQVTGISLIIFNSNNYSGSIGLDNIKLEEVDSSGATLTTLPLVNSDFQGGHNQFATGDWAASFTSRLNGAAFWGSTGHNGGGVVVFQRLTDTLADFIGGAPLAKAVWQNEISSSVPLYNTGGLLYGDPLYSPLHINIRPNVGAASETTLKAGQLPIVIDAVNGTDNSTRTQYRVDVCHANPLTNAYADFFVCDRENSWISTGISGTSGGSNISATLNASQYAKTVHTLRIVVTAINNQNQTQTYQHFFTFFGIGRFLTAAGNYDTDGDGLDDETEIYIQHTDPLKPDSDGDGLTDGDEINIYQTSPFKTDTDGDGLSDGDEVNIYKTFPTIIDTDGDGHSDGQEVKDGTNPLDPASFRVHQIPAILWQRMVN